jgi:hypothetical protein
MDGVKDKKKKKKTGTSISGVSRGAQPLRMIDGWSEGQEKEKENGYIN